jgi:hypothetical protein
LLPGADLDQTKLRVIGLLAHELGVDGSNRHRAERLDESRECGVVVDPTDFLRCRHRRSSLGEAHTLSSDFVPAETS